MALTLSCTAGIRVIPPTRITSSISPAERPESVNAWRQGPSTLAIRSATNCSRRARLRDLTKCWGPLASAVMKGKLISVSRVLDSSILARSAASRNRCRAIRSLPKSIPVSWRNSWINQSRICWSKSSPPRKVSPLVDSTSNTPSPICRMVMSKVPPPRSKTAMVASSLPLVQAVGHGSGGWFIDNAQHVQAGDGAGVLGGLPLVVVEIGRYGDHRLGDPLSQLGLGVLTDLLEDEG